MPICRSKKVKRVRAIIVTQGERERERSIIGNNVLSVSA